MDSRNGDAPDAALAPSAEPRTQAPRREVMMVSDGDAPRGSRERRPRRAAPEVPAGQTRLYLNLGRRDGAEEPAVRELLTQHNISPLVLDVMSSHSYLNVAEAEADGVIARLCVAHYGERALCCERAKP